MPEIAPADPIPEPVIRPNRSVWVLPTGRVVDVQAEGANEDGSAFSHGIYVKKWIAFRLDRFFPGSDAGEVEMARQMRRRAKELIDQEPEDPTEEGENPFAGDLAYDQAAEEKGWVRIKPPTGPEAGNVIYAETMDPEVASAALICIAQEAARSGWQVKILSGGALANRASFLFRNQAMSRSGLEAEAARLSSMGFRGWLSPDGEYIESEETPALLEPGRLGGHENAALSWILANSPELERELEKRLEEEGFDCIEQAAGANLIKQLMVESGFHRVAPE